MERALTRYCNQLYNYFEVGQETGTFEIAGGRLECPFLKPGQYFRIVGSLYNNGVHQYPVYDCIDEVFTGVIFPMAVPVDFLDLVNTAEIINEFIAEYNSNPTGFKSESFGVYSYSRDADPYTVAMERSAEVNRALKRYRKVAFN